jgi:LemA protein
MRAPPHRSDLARVEHHAHGLAERLGRHVREELGLDAASADSKLNVDGGAIAIGHPLAASGALDGALNRLIGLVEAYPELKANASALQLQEELVSTENRIAFARQAYNDAVMTYNTRLAVFPDLLVARLFSFMPAALFETDDASRALPAVDFGAGGSS